MTIDSNGVAVYYEQHGKAGPDVLLLHGWGCNVDLWKPITDRLSASTRVTAIDFPGHGKSGRPPEPWDAAAHARLVADIIERLGLSGCVIVGHSHGGRVALRLALDRPELIGKLVITCGAGLRGKPTAKAAARSRLYKALRSGLNVLARLRVFGGLTEKWRGDLRKAFGSKDYNALDEEMRKTFVLLVNTDMTEELHGIKAPTLLIWGDADTETPLWMGQTMERLIPDAGLVVFDGASHFAYLEQPERFASIVRAFVCG